MANLRSLLDLSLVLSETQTLSIRRIADRSAALKLPVFLVGGFVRDVLLNQAVNDFDVVVEGDAIELGKALVKEHGGKLTSHPKFKTATWFFSREGDGFLDLATARAETYSRPGALPTIKPSTIGDDLHRRDFTINAMAVRLDGHHFGELLDPLGGQSDLENRLIRVLHRRSFIDDPTRMLRAVRYEQRYGFRIAPQTLHLFHPDSFSVLARLSGERLRHEYDLILDEENAVAMLRRLGELGLLNAVKPPLPAIDQRLAASLDSGPPKKAGVVYDRRVLGYLLWLMGLPEDRIASLSRRLDFPAVITRLLRQASRLLADLPGLAGSKPSRWALRLDKIAPLAIYAVFCVTGQSALEEYLVNWRHIKPGITGEDLKARGIQPGPQYRLVLQRLRAAWLDDEVHSRGEEAALLSRLLDL